MPARYARKLAKRVEESMLPSGALRFLIDVALENRDDPYALDIQLREGNELMYYHGTTCLLTIRISNRNSTLDITATAHEAYGQHAECRAEYAALMKTWRITESATLEQAVRFYLPKAIRAADARYYDNKKEGYWQNRLCVRFGPRWRCDDEWLILDRECVLGFDTSGEKTDFYAQAREKFAAFRRQLQDEDSTTWGQITDKGFGDELDLLAIDPAGRLVVLELKHGSNAAGIYWGPLQTYFYGDAFTSVLGEIRDDLLNLAHQKIRLGLLPEAAGSRLGREGLSRVEPVLAIAEPNENSACWDRMDQVLRRSTSGLGLPQSMSIARIHDDHGKPKVELGHLPVAP